MSELKKKARELFLILVDLSTEEREAEIHRRADGSELEREVRALLTAHDQSGSFIETPIMTEASGEQELDGDRIVEVVFGWIEFRRTNPSADLDEYCELFSEDQRSEVRRHCQSFSARVPSRWQLPPDHVPRSIDRCIVLGELGRGMMGVVYLAWQSSLQRLVAIKVMLPEVGGSIRAEAARAAKLHHPGIVPILHYGEDHETSFIIMEYSDSGTLADRFECQRKSEEQSQESSTESWVAEVVETTARIADALQAAHEQRILHRDLKPQNILIDDEGRPRISDFGLACDLSEVRDSGDEVAGTLAYMSPEQAMARNVLVDNRSDIFSLGVMLYEGLTLRRPFSGDSQVDLIKQIASADPRDVRDLNPAVPMDLRAIVLKSLEKDRDRRYGQAKDFAADLRAFQRGEQPRAAKWSLLKRGLRATIEHRAALLISAAILIAALTLFWFQSRAGTERLTISADRPVTTFIRTLDLASGEYGEGRRLGRGRSGRFRVPRGDYRVVVAWPGGFREFQRTIDRPTSVEAITIEPPRPSSTEAMVMIRSTDFVAGVGGRSLHFPRRRYRLPEFWIDRHEVTIREYRVFLDATRHPWPEVWNGEYPEEYEGKPVAGIRWESARAYAEFVGKRLPTRLEWQRAARGTTGQLYPWGDDPADVEQRACVGRLPGEETLSEDSYYPAYLRRTVNPGTLDDLTVDGVEGMLGNVREWTETIYTKWEDGGVAAVPTRRCVMGFSWEKRADHVALNIISSYPIASVIHRSTVGFRCAKSVDPLNVPEFLSSLEH